MYILNLFNPWSDMVLAGICGVVKLPSRPEKIKGHYIVRCVEPITRKQLYREQLLAATSHIMRDISLPKNRPKFGRIMGIIEVDGCSPYYHFQQGKQFFKLKIKKVYRLREPLTVEEYIRLFGDGFPTRGYIEEIPLLK